MSEVSERLHAIAARAADCQTYNFGLRNADQLAHNDVPYLLTLARKQAAALDAIEAMHTFAHKDVEQWAKGFRYAGDHCAYDGEHWPCATIAAITKEPTP